MVEARLTSPEVLRKILEALRELVEEANIECNETGMHLQAMDFAHVSLVAMHLNDSAFDRYACSESTVLGLNLGSVLKILKCGGSNDVLTLKTSEEGQELKYQFESTDSDRLFEFSMSLMDIDSDHLAVPDYEADCEITLPSSQFQRICKDLTQFGEVVKISVNNKSVSFAVAGETGKGSITLESFKSAKDDQSVQVKCEEPVELSFALKYLNFFAKATPLAQTVKLLISLERPLQVNYELSDDIGYIKYYLAPKVNEEDEAEQAEE